MGHMGDFRSGVQREYAASTTQTIPVIALPRRPRLLLPPLARVGLAADRRKYLAGVEAGEALGGEEDIRGRDLVGLRRSIHRVLAPERRRLLGRHGGGDQR